MERIKGKLKPPLKITENDVKRQIKDYLTAKGWFHFPLTAGLGTHPGAPDMIACKNGRVIFVEVKRPGGKQRPGQKVFQDNVEAEKCEYILAESYEDLERRGV